MSGEEWSDGGRSDWGSLSGSRRRSSMSRGPRVRQVLFWVLYMHWFTDLIVTRPCNLLKCIKQHSQDLVSGRLASESTLLSISSCFYAK